MTLKFKRIVHVSLLSGLLAVTGSVAVFGDSPRPRVQDIHRTWEWLDLRFMLTPNFGFNTQLSFRTEHYRRDTYDPKTAQTSHNGEALGIMMYELQPGLLYHLRLDDSFRITFGMDYNYTGLPRSDVKDNSRSRDNYPYEHALNIYATPAYTIGSVTLMGRLYFYNQLFQGNTERWVGDARIGWDESEERGYALVTRVLAGIEYSLTKTATVFARFEVFYGTIADDETRFVPENERSTDPNKTYERTATNNNARLAYGDGGFAKVGYSRNRASIGYSLKLAPNVSFINQYICETNLNPDFDPDSPVSEDRIQVRNIVHYLFFGMILTFNLY